MGSTDDRAEVWDVNRVRARKRYVCVGCREPICVGTVHERIGVLFERSWSTVRVHFECHEFARELSAGELARGGVYHVEDLRGQLRDTGAYRDDPTLLCTWRTLRRARLREQRGRASLCPEIGEWPEGRDWPAETCAANYRFHRIECQVLMLGPRRGVVCYDR